MNPFTRVCCSGGSSSGSTTVVIQNDAVPRILTGNQTGVTASNDEDPTHVTLAIRGDTSISNRLHVKECLADDFFKTSDITKKKDIQQLDLKESEKIVKNMQAIQYKWKDTTKKKTKNIGYSAQQAQQLDNSLVDETDAGLTLNYSALTVHTSNVVRSLLNRIDELEKKIS